MSVAGAAISAGAAIGSTVYGGITASKNARKQRREIEKRKRNNKNWFDRLYNEDYTQRADAQRLLTMTEERIKQRNKDAAGTAAVMGGTPELTAANNEANSKEIADVTSAIAAAGAERKDKIESEYRSREDAAEDLLMQMRQQKDANTSAAVQSGLNSVSQIASAYGSSSGGAGTVKS